MKFLLLLSLMLVSCNGATENKTPGENIELPGVSGSIRVIVDKDRQVVCYVLNRGTWASEGNAISCIKLEK